MSSEDRATSAAADIILIALAVAVAALIVAGAVWIIMELFA